jgi:hypothetical protein
VVRRSFSVPKRNGRYGSENRFTLKRKSAVSLVSHGRETVKITSETKLNKAKGRKKVKQKRNDAKNNR